MDVIRGHLATPDAVPGRICDGSNPALFCRAAAFASLKDLSAWVPKVFLAAEDATFYQRPAEKADEKKRARRAEI